MKMTFDNVKEELLNRANLAPRHSNMDYLAPALALFGGGLLIGAGLGLLLAPRPGAELRHDLKDKIQHVPDAFAWLPRYVTEAAQKEETNGQGKKYARHEWPPTA